jgi:hypothetical protein
MTREQKFELAALAIGAIVVAWWLTRGNASASVNAEFPVEVTAPFVPSSSGAGLDYLSYNLPKMEAPQLPSVTPPSNPSMPTTSPGCPNACGCTGSQQYFSGNQAFMDFLNAQFSDMAKSYAENVASVMPSWLGVNFVED